MATLFELSHKTFFNLLILCFVSLISAHVLFPNTKAYSQSSNDIIRQLQCQPGQACDRRKTRGVTRGLTRSIGKTRQFKFEPDTAKGKKDIEQSAASGDLPSTDQEIYFAFNSADILPQAKVKLNIIGQALTSEQLSNDRFILVGHTDAKGSDDYNQNLSEKRARSVRAYLLETFAISPKRLTAFGRGESKLKFPEEPFAAANRRVQIINYQSAKVADR